MSLPLGLGEAISTLEKKDMLILYTMGNNLSKRINCSKNAELDDWAF